MRAYSFRAVCAWFIGILALLASADMLQAQYASGEAMPVEARPPTALPQSSPIPAAQFTAVPAAQENVAPSLGLGDVTGKVQMELDEIVALVSQVWNCVIFTSSDGAKITVQTLVIGLALLLLGYVAAKRISNWLGTKVLARIGVHASAAAPMQKISFYVLVATFTLFSLNWLGVPLAMFTFLGGALAIGVGFGSQNIVNNFISGLILLAERPIRVGDVIEIDKLVGKVSDIGARSTRITTGANLEIIVPNSKFLETNVINWTLSDDKICSTITIGVAYGSSTREAARLLKLAAVEHKAVLPHPEPEVLFKEFGDNALIFHLQFWLHLRASAKVDVESQLRFRIDELFNQAGIVIAYPQRDVHLNVMRPVEVRLSQASSETLRRAA